MMQDELMQILDFTAEDLQANRQNRRSPTQQAALERRRRGFWKESMYVIAFIALVTLLAWILDPIMNMYVIGTSGWIIVMGIMVVITLVIIALLYDNKRMYRLDAREDAVESVTGTLRLTGLPNNTSSGSLKVKSRLFALNQEQFQALAKLAPLPKATVYFAPRSQHLFSVDTEKLLNGETDFAGKTTGSPDVPPTGA